MIRAPINDEDCLGQLTQIARELAPTTLVQMVARRLGSADAVIRWLRSLPQADDDGYEGVRYIQCDVPQRVRLLPDDPNCVERAAGALMLLEAIDPRTPRALATIDRPLRHTGLVELRGGHWHAVDLFPRRNFNWGEFGKDVLQGVHSYVGKPLLSFYGLGGVADQLGEGENKLIGRDQKKPDPKKPEQQANEKKDQPPPKGREQPGNRSSPQPTQAGQQPRQQRLTLATFTGAIGAGGKDEDNSTTKGGKDGKEQTKQDRAGAFGSDSARDRAAQAADRDGGDPHDEGTEAQRWWWRLR